MFRQFRCFPCGRTTEDSAVVISREIFQGQQDNPLATNHASLLSRYFNQGLRFMSTFKFDYAVESHREALRLDPDCSMCEWGLGLAYSQNINDALVMALEPEFLSNEPLAYEAVSRAQALLAADGGADEDSPTHARDTALVSAFSLKLVPTVKEYESHFVDGLPASLNLAYAEAMAEAASRSEEEGWPDRAMVLLLSADAWMNISPWDCEFVHTAFSPRSDVDVDALCCYERMPVSSFGAPPPKIGIPFEYSEAPDM